MYLQPARPTGYSDEEWAEEMRKDFARYAASKRRWIMALAFGWQPCLFLIMAVYEWLHAT